MSAQTVPTSCLDPSLAVNLHPLISAPSWCSLISHRIKKHEIRSRADEAEGGQGGAPSARDRYPAGAYGKPGLLLRNKTVNNAFKQDLVRKL